MADYGREPHEDPEELIINVADKLTEKTRHYGNGKHAFGYVYHKRDEGGEFSYDPEDVSRPDIAASMPADVDAFKKPGEDEARGDRADKIREEDRDKQEEYR